MQGGFPEPESYQGAYDEVDLREYVLVLWKRRTLVAAVTLGAMVVSGILSFFVLRPVYEASVYLRTVQGDLKDFSPAQIINTQYFAAAVIKSMGTLSQYPPRELMSMVTVREIPNTRMTEIVVEHSDPLFASRLANAVASVFEDELKRAAQEAVKKASGGAEEAITQAKEALTQAYQRKNSLEAQIGLVEVELNRLKGMVASYKSSLSEAELRKVELLKGLEELEKALDRTPKTVSGPPDWQGKPTEIPNQTYQSLEQEVALQRADLAQVLARAEELRRVIPEVEKQLTERADERSRLSTQRDEIDQRIRSLEEVVRNLTQRLAQYQASVPEVVTASPAMVPDKPVKPRKLLNVAVAGVLGFFLSVMWVLVQESWVRPSRRIDQSG